MNSSIKELRDVVVELNKIEEIEMEMIREGKLKGDAAIQEIIHRTKGCCTKCGKITDDLVKGLCPECRVINSCTKCGKITSDLEDGLCSECRGDECGHIIGMYIRPNRSETVIELPEGDEATLNECVKIANDRFDRDFSLLAKGGKGGWLVDEKKLISDFRSYYVKERPPLEGESLETIVESFKNQTDADKEAIIQEFFKNNYSDIYNSIEQEKLSNLIISSFNLINLRR